MNDNAPKREIHRLAIALDGVNKGLEAKFCNGEPILTIHPDGRVTTSDKLKPDEIASAVLQMMKEQWMANPQARLIRELNDRIKQLDDNRTKAAANSLANMMAYEDAIAKIKKLEQLLNKIEEILKRPAANHRLMQIAGPARQVINIIKQAKEAKP